MGITRRIVFPALRIAILTAIAVALLKLAFGADPEPTSQPLTPSAEVTDPQVPVSLGTVANTVTVDDAVITADPAVPVKATAEGEVTVIMADPGEIVAVDDPLLEVVSEEPGGTVTETDDEGNEVETQGEPQRRYRTIRAPVAGTVGEYEVLPGQSVAIGDAVGSVTTGRFSVSGAIGPEEQYRLVARPGSALVTARGGPAPFGCTDLTIGRQDDDEDAPPVDPAMPGTGSGTSITCSVPSEVRVFDGLSATMNIEAGVAEDVLVVPVTAVQGSFASGTVWVALPDGSSEERAVMLGLTDGEMVEVTEGLAEGDMILEFIPVPDDQVEDDVYGREFAGG
ncbi:MAG: efflux RND transporter periplasmic adaptor subunit [Jiangellaceae bacterium]